MTRAPLRRLLGVALAVGALLAAPVRAGDAPDPVAVQKAIDAGAAWLRKDLAARTPGETDHELTELAALTLAHAGANLTDATFASAIESLATGAPRFTYRTALQAMALQEVNPRLHQAKIAHCAQWLVDTQLPGGEWGYPGSVNGPGRRPDGILVEAPPLPEGHRPGDRIAVQKRSSVTGTTVEKGDFSNTQFAILGLRAARDAGVEVPKETWKKALEYLRKWQREDGGWGYVLQGEADEGAYASLTCAGLCSTVVCLSALGTKDPKGDPTVKKALAWLDRWLDPTRNAGIETSSVRGPSRWQYYHLYSLERAGRVLGLATVGKRDWYAEGAAWLLAQQKPDGRWSDDGEDADRPSYLAPAETCFAILFLARATRPITR